VACILKLVAHLFVRQDEIQDYVMKAYHTPNLDGREHHVSDTGHHVLARSFYQKVDHSHWRTLDNNTAALIKKYGLKKRTNPSDEVFSLVVFN
jgi:hypothetical protein